MASPSPFVFTAGTTTAMNTNAAAAAPHMSQLPVSMSFAFDAPSPSSSVSFSTATATDDDDSEEAADDGNDGAGEDETTDRDEEDREEEGEEATDSDTDGDDGYDAMDVDFEAVHGKFAQMDLDSDSEPSPTPSEDDDDAPNPHIPPHFTSPLYESWLAAQTPNIIFTIRIKPLFEGSMIAAHSIRLWYRDFKTRGHFLDAIVDEYQLLDASEISGFVIKERRSKVWVELGTDMESWDLVMDRIRNKFADENLTGSAMAVRAELKVYVGGEDELDGVVVEKGTFAVDPTYDPDL